ncbi:MAG: DUF1476 domain-containing protein [Pseudomonadota bacterium]|nr:DUF1476 domain-containing protein [Pseudomonadota bacterium]
MTSGFEEREKGFEEKWGRDEELRFKVHARRDKLIGLWAAGEMGVTGAAAEAYAKDAVQAGLAENGEAAVFKKIRSDFDAKSVARSDHLINTKMAEFLETAKKQVMEGI